MEEDGMGMTPFRAQMGLPESYSWKWVMAG